jgi:hypothetical protein
MKVLVTCLLTFLTLCVTAALNVVLFSENTDSNKQNQSKLYAFVLFSN